MKISDLKKKIVVGTELTLVKTMVGPCRLKRVVIEVRSRDFVMSGDGFNGKPIDRTHTSWPKRGELHETEKGFELTDEDGYVMLEYEWGYSSQEKTA